MGKFGKIIVISSLALMHIGACDAKQHRSQSARHNFAKLNPCPSTGKPALPCPGYIIDHITPLCAGGADSPINMQWQTVAASKEKDKLERRQCRK